MRERSGAHRGSRSGGSGERGTRGGARKRPATATQDSGVVNGSTGTWDRVGVLASAACALHCLVTPLLFLAVPAFAEVWAHPAAHLVVALLVLPLAGSVLVSGYRLHRCRWVASSALAGASFIAVGCVLPFAPGEVHAGEGEPGIVGHDHGAHRDGAYGHDCCAQLTTNESGETDVSLPPATVVTLLGSALLIGCHVRNLTQSRCCSARPTP